MACTAKHKTLDLKALYSFGVCVCAYERVPVETARHNTLLPSLHLAEALDIVISLASPSFKLGYHVSMSLHPGVQAVCIHAVQDSIPIASVLVFSSGCTP